MSATAERLLKLYQGRETVHAIAHVTGANGDRKVEYRPVHRALTLEDLEQHLAGSVVIGVYPIREDSTCLFGAIDVDAEDEEDLGLGTAKKLRQAAIDLSFPETAMMVTFSGRKGHHVDLFFADPIPAGTVRMLLHAVVVEAGFDVEDFELFPKQDGIDPRVPTNLGNLIKLPLTTHPLTGQKAKIVISPRQPVQPAPAKVVYEILGGVQLPKAAERQREPRPAPDTTYVKGHRTKRIEQLAGFLNGEGVSLNAAEQACLDENEAHCSPPLPAERVRETVDGIYRRYSGQHRQGPAARGMVAPLEEPDQDQQSAEASPLPPLELEWLPAPLAALSAHLAEIWNVDPALYALPGLAILSAAIGNTAWLHLPGGVTAPAAVWLSLIARTGSGKTPAAEMMAHPLVAAQEPLDYEFLQAMDEWKRLPKAQREMTPRPQPRRLYINDSTWEATVRTLAHNPGGALWMRDEIGGIFKQLDAYHGQNGDFASEDLLSTWSQQTIRRDRVRDGEYTIVLKPYLSIYGGLQPSRAQILGNNDSGRLARLLVYQTDRMPELEGDNPNEELVQAWSDLVTALVQGRMGEEYRSWELRPTGEARAYWKELQRQRSKEVRAADDETAAYLAKLDQHAARFGVIKHVCDHLEAKRREVDLDAIHAGWKTARTLVDHQLAVFKPMVSDFIIRPEERALEEAVVKLDQWVARQGGRARRREALNKHAGGARDGAALDRLIRLWTERHLGRTETETPERGGPTTLWLVKGAGE